MIIIKLEAENVKNLKAISITPDGNLVQITGPNGCGKSSTLDSIVIALTGQVPDDIVRHGTDRAEINIDCGEFKVKKILTEKGSRLEVTNAQGDVKKSPQTFLNEVFGKLTFDPLAFKNQDPKKQLEVLRELAGLNFDDLEKEAKIVFEERTGLNSRVRDTIAQIDGMEAPEPDTPDEEISFGDALDEINALQEQREGWKRAQEARKQLETGIAQAKDTIEAKRRQITQLAEEIKRGEMAILEGQAKIDQIYIPPEITITQIMAKKGTLEDIEKKNVAIRSAARYRKLIKDSNKLRDEAEALTQRLDRIRQDRQTRIANAQFPLAGLSLTDDGVIYNGTVFNRLSTGEQIRISTAIAMRLNPHLKIILIRDGSLLDSYGLKEIAELAGSHGYQCWIETVAEPQIIDGKEHYPCGIYISEGMIEAINGQKVELND
jgi:chromosome segregation ATPase